jgi:signal transduction histidine kinase
MDRDRIIDALVRFARTVSDAATPSEILTLLADAGQEHVGAGGVCVVELSSVGGAHIAVARGLPPEAARLVPDPDSMGEEFGRALSAACAGAFAHSETRPLVASGSLFGAVIMLFNVAPPSERQLQLADGLVDLTSTALASAMHLEKLEKSNAELRASQEMLSRSEKLRALGQMAAGVSHDLKNILNPLSLHLQFADRSLARGKLEEVHESIVEMRQVVVRGVETVERLRSYSRQSKESKLELVDLDVLAREAAAIAKPRMAATGHLVRIEEQLSGPPSVLAVPSELVNALVNLVVNAIEAIGDAGRVIQVRTGASEDGSFVEIEDDGPGMPPEIEQRVFEPFFTTKGHEGTGLGLAMVYATVQRFAGRVTLDTEVGRGTRFRLWFPGPTPPG